MALHLPIPCFFTPSMSAISSTSSHTRFLGFCVVLLTFEMSVHKLSGSVVSERRILPLPMLIPSTLHCRTRRSHLTPSCFGERLCSTSGLSLLMAVQLPMPCFSTP